MKSHIKNFDGTRESYEKIVAARVRAMNVHPSVAARIYARMTTDAAWATFKEEHGIFDGDTKGIKP